MQKLDGSRHEIFSSNQELIEASEVMVTGTVLSQQEKTIGDDLAPTTFSEVEVIASFTPEGLARNTPENSAPQIRAGDTITVMQLGGKGWDTPYPLLAEKQTYLLLLNSSGVEGVDGYYTAGGPAGIFTPTASGFEPTSTDGDKLTAISSADLKGLPQQ
ncbi:hypothetical protein [Microbacterium sp. LWH10-1.2]|uniref:hypothetical protein n=1 Tax=Microbacterium sp. LWH10-1.2 TaxID=3135255 RepID=UPI0031391EE1